MLSWVVQNFILVIYSNATQLTYSLIGLLAMARRVIWIRSVRPSAQTFSWNWLFSFFRELNVVLGTHVVLCMTARFFEKNVLPSKRGKLARLRVLWVLKKVQFFFLVLYFFISLVYNESLHNLFLCAWTDFIFGKILVSEIWPKILLANQTTGFFNQSQDSKIGCI